MITNRDLYRWTLEVESDRTLEAYLRALWAVGARRNGEPIDARDVLEMLQVALEFEPPTFDPAWNDRFEEAPEPEEDGWTDWCNAVQFQVVDLRRMEEAGQLEDPERWFGIQSPSGTYWYNFDVQSYLESAVRGAVGGDAPAMVGEESDVFVLEDFGWAQFCDMLWCGQHFEP